ncbi:hypothetical protein D3C73_184800 [compost metagenome]
MVTKEEYVLKRVMMLTEDHRERNIPMDAKVLDSLIKQWDFDYEAEKIYHPGELMRIL